MAAEGTIAQALMDGEPAAVEQIAGQLLKPLANNLVERPWGGLRIREYKGLYPLPDQIRVTGLGLGEAFEIAAYDDDEEARAHPSRLRFGDGSVLALPELLRRHACVLLGEALASRHRSAFPLLPKTLDVKELLSVQGHPEGHTEVYVVIDADPGATIRVGFNRDMDPAELENSLLSGRARQQELLNLLRGRFSPERLHAMLAPWLAARDVGIGELPAELCELVARGEGGRRARGLLERLKALYWRVLDSMNTLPVEPGTIVHNANPARIARARGRRPSAEVHALGNPEGREILALEIRRPGPTFRAWDNVRFPLRSIDVRAAVGALNLCRIEPEELIVSPSAVPGRDGVYHSVSGEGFSIEHLRPSPARPVAVPAEPVHSLHAISGSVVIETAQGRALGALRRGESALVPIGVGAYRIAADANGAQVVKVHLGTQG